ncbi:hypothetical protein T03_14287 [Trichinella britovi]|uniref:Uncharacterized protein n=1 Tax=Trichinella britovi TaxID=45882 RepID=A0A0V0ZC60_TRIBR|nr:hypothetical protein T03_14287 [Trichinella britovi]
MVFVHRKREDGGRRSKAGGNQQRCRAGKLTSPHRPFVR